MLQEVVVGVLYHDHRALLCRRKSNDDLNGKWEFPGGKVERGESTLAALRRELQEELNVRILAWNTIHREEVHYSSERSFSLTFFEVSAWEGEISSSVYDELQWVNPIDIPSLDILAGNRNFVHLLPSLLQSDNDDDAHYMEQALEQAHKALEKNEVPIGAIIVHSDIVIARSHNEMESKQIPTAHAEIQAIESAALKLGSRRLLDCTLYVTLEPCIMCAGAIVLARIPRVVFACSDPKAGAAGSLYSLLSDKQLNHRCSVRRGVLAGDASLLLRDFFQSLRRTTT